MKINFKKILVSILIASPLILGITHIRYIHTFVTLNTDPEIQKYADQVKDKFNIIMKNKNENKELILIIKSKQNDLDMALKSLQYKKANVLNEQTENLLSDEKSIKYTLDKFKNLNECIKNDKKSKKYITMLNDMDNLISNQTSKLLLLKKLDSDLDTTLAILH